MTVPPPHPDVYDRERLLRVLRESGDPANPTPDEIHDIVRSTQRIAVVGLSRDPMKAARRVPSYLAAKGADLIAVNPNAARLFGKPPRKSLEDVHEAVDVVLVFRPSSDAGSVIRSAAARAEKPVIWLQEGIRADVEAAEARKEGRTVVQDLCMYKVHRAMGGTLRKGDPL